MPDRVYSTPFGAFRTTESGLLLRDTTIADATTARHGLLPKLSGNGGDVLRGDGTWGSVSASGGIPQSIMDAKGDLLAASADDTPARLAVGANTRMLMADSSQTTGLAWAVDYGVDLTGTDDYLFDAAGVTSLPSGWSWEQQGSSTYREEFGRGAIIWDTGAFNFIRAIYRSLPGTFNSCLLNFSAMQQLGNGGPGLILRNSSSGKLCHFSLRTNSTINLTFFSAANGSVGSDTSSTFSVTSTMDNVYLKIVRNSSSSWDFRIGMGPNDMQNIFSAVNVPTQTQGFTPDQIGFGCLCIPNTARTASLRYIKFT